MSYVCVSYTQTHRLTDRVTQIVPKHNYRRAKRSPLRVHVLRRIYTMLGHVCVTLHVNADRRIRLRRSIALSGHYADAIYRNTHTHTHPVCYRARPTSHAKIHDYGRHALHTRWLTAHNTTFNVTKSIMWRCVFLLLLLLSGVANNWATHVPGFDFMYSEKLCRVPMWLRVRFSGPKCHSTACKQTSATHQPQRDCEFTSAQTRAHTKMKVAHIIE